MTFRLAGIALMNSTNQEGWAIVAAEINLIEPNHAAFGRVKKPQPCTIVMSAPEQ